MTFVITQISTSVQQTTEVVLLKPAVLTPWAASRVPVIQDTPEMDSPAQVTVLEHVNTVVTGDGLTCTTELTAEDRAVLKNRESRRFNLEL